MQALRAGGGRMGRATPVITALALACCGCLSAQRAQAQTAPAPEACPAPPGAVTTAPPPSAPAQPSLTPAAAQIVVCVASLPITGAVFTHWAAVAGKNEGQAPKHPATAREVVDEVLGFLISSDWVLEEARALHVHVSARTVRRSFERIRAQQFPKPGEFGKFLMQSGQTVDDLLFRVKVNLLTMRVQRHVLAGHRSAGAGQRTLVRFVRNFKRRWRPRTYCTPEYAVADCGHVVSPPL